MWAGKAPLGLHYLSDRLERVLMRGEMFEIVWRELGGLESVTKFN